MASADVQGKFLWHELVTNDPAAAGAFYGKVLGWTPQAWDKDPSYTVLLTPKGPVGGIMKPGADAHAGGSSAHWMSYIGSNSVEDTVAAAQRLGGRILKGASDIPGGGRYAVVADPQGAVFGIHTPAASAAGGHATDAFTWHELTTSDHAAALRFYRELFGWEQLAVHDMGAMGPYVIFGRGGQQLGGMFSRSGASANWLAYVRVPSASKAAETAKAAGGKLINGPHQVPGGSWIAQLADPHGAAIAVNQPETAGESAQPAKPAAQAPKSAAPAPKPAAPAPKPAVQTSQPAVPAPKPVAKPAAVTSAPAKPAVAAAPAHSASTVKPAEPAKAAPANAAPAKTPAKAPARAAASAKAPAARKTAARKSAGSRKKKTARPARKKSAAAKRSANKGSAARSRSASAKKAKKKAKKTGKRSAPARKSARGKRAKGRSKRR